MMRVALLALTMGSAGAIVPFLAEKLGEAIMQKDEEAAHGVQAVQDKPLFEIVPESSFPHMNLGLLSTHGRLSLKTDPFQAKSEAWKPSAKDWSVLARPRWHAREQASFEQKPKDYWLNWQAKKTPENDVKTVLQQVVHISEDPSLTRTLLNTGTALTQRTMPRQTFQSAPASKPIVNEYENFLK